MIRLLSALEIPPSIRQELSSIRPNLKKANWIDEKNYHLTVQFIGEVDDFVYRKIRDGLHQVEAFGFELTLEGLGHFGEKEAASHFWAGIHGNKSLVILRNKIVGTLKEIGINPKEKKFVPHVTLAKTSQVPSGDIQKAIDDNVDFKSSTFRVNSFYLLSSHRDGQASSYRIEETYSLG